MAGRVFGDEGETHALRQMGLDHLNRHIGKTFRRWKEDLRSDYGEVGERRLWRIITWLIDNKLVRRSDEEFFDEEWDDGGQMSYVYFRVSDTAPVLKAISCCGLCGARGATQKTHISHRMHRYFRHARGFRQSHARLQSYEVIEYGLPAPTPRPPESFKASRPRASRAAEPARQAA